MGKCFITKLDGSTNNSSILRIGEMRIKFNKENNPTKSTQGFSVGSKNELTLNVVGNGYFTDETLTQNLGNTITITNTTKTVYVSNGAEVAVLNKYILESLSYNNSNFDKNFIIDLSSLKYSNKLSFLNIGNTLATGSLENLKGLYNLNTINLGNTLVDGDIKSLQGITALTAIHLYRTQVSGNIGDLKTLTSLSTLNLASTQVSGNVGELKTLTALTSLNLSATSVSGNIGDLKTLTSLSTLNLASTQVSGNVGELKTLTSLSTLFISNNNIPLVGDIGELSSLTNIKSITLNSSRLSGDLATVPASCKYVSFERDAGSTMTWGTRPSSASIIAINGNASLANIDKMLQDQAKCQVGFTSSDPITYKTISVAGNRTSASDDAVATLQQKGYTISIAKA